MLGPSVHPPHRRGRGGGLSLVLAHSGLSQYIYSRKITEKNMKKMTYILTKMGKSEYKNIIKRIIN